MDSPSNSVRDIYKTSMRNNIINDVLSMRNNNTNDVYILK